MATFTNQATLTYNGGTVNSNIVTGELVQVLTASKTAAAESYRTGDLVTYVVQLRSTGAAALTGLTVTDTLGTTNFPATGGTVQLTPLTYQAGTLRYFMNGVLQTAPAVRSSTEKYRPACRPAARKARRNSATMSVRTVACATLWFPNSDGQSAKPSWCFAVRTAKRQPALLAICAQRSQSGARGAQSDSGKG